MQAIRPGKPEKKSGGKVIGGSFFSPWDKYRPVLLKNEKMKFART